MIPLFQRESFLDFGPSDFVLTCAAGGASRIDAHKISELRKQVRLLAPKRPGVYGMVDHHHELIYVGKAKDLRSRLLSYFRPRGRPPKAGKILKQTTAILWEVCPSEFASLLRELELIRRWRPRFNVVGQPLRRRQTFLCLGRKPAPYAFLAPKPPHAASAVFGPLPLSGRTTDAIRRLNEWFLLRDCPQSQELSFPEQGELFSQIRPAGCLRFDLGTCLAPCTGGCAQSTYQQQVRKAHAFLDGRDTTLLQALQEKMQAAAVALEYERAAVLRDRLASLSWLAHRLERLRYAQERMSFIYPVAGCDGSQTWYLVHGARTVRTLIRPESREQKKEARAAIEAVYRGNEAHRLLERYEHVDGMMLVLAWFGRHASEMKRTLSPGDALKWCAIV